ncbi:unnamed protein product, partial [Rotaria magnacalcarata]
MSWNSQGFLDSPAYNQQYGGPTAYELHQNQQQQQQQQQQQHYAPPQPHLPYPSGNFMPSQYNINPQGNSAQFYRP